MLPEALLDGLLSKDAHRIWEAASRITRLRDRDALQWLAEHDAGIRAATAGVYLGGAFRPNEVILSQALRRMEMARGSACFCSLYAEDMFANPQREADDGFIEVLSLQDNTETLETDWLVTCKACGKQLQIKQNDGWHVPTYRWTPKRP
jgi:hypothetical protein